MAWKLVTIDNWNSLVERLRSMSGSGGLPRILCRGQSKPGRLIASVGRIFRRQGVSREQGWELERRAAWEFRRKLTPAQAKPARDRRWPLELRLWPLMQHHGSPTWLLDWTWSPYVAAYHAVRERFDRDGVILAFDLRVLTQADHSMQDGPRLSRHSLSRMTRQEFDRAFGGQVSGSDSLFVLEPMEPFRRQIMQQGTFTVATSAQADHGVLIARATKQSGDQPPLAIVIPAAVKRSILHELHAMNIGPHTLFPGTDGLGRHVRETLELMVDLVVNLPGAPGSELEPSNLAPPKGD
jgi:hypothetical protein